MIANAAIPERGPPFLLDSNLDDDGELAEPNLDLVEVNLNGTLRSMSPSISVACDPHYFQVLISSFRHSHQTCDALFRDELTSGRLIGDDRLCCFVRDPWPLLISS